MEEFHGLSWLEIRNCYSFLCAALIAPVGKESACGRTGFDSWVEKIPWGKGNTTHSSTVAWRIPRTVSSMVSQRVGHD